MWLELYKTLRSEDNSTEMTKFIYKNGVRKRLEKSSLIYERKIFKKKETHYDVCCAGKNIFVVSPIMYKESTEEFINAATIADKLEQPIAKIQRIYVVQNNGVRIAVERKFFPFPDVTESITAHNYYDIFNYEYFTCSIHLEIENDIKEILIEKLKQCISENALVKALVCIMKFGNSTSQYIDMVQPTTNAAAERSLCRQFAYTVDGLENPMYIAWKLDGERAKFEIINNVMYIPQWSIEFVLDNVYFAQTLVGHVERIISKEEEEYLTIYVMIDLYFVSSMRQKQMLTLNHIDAIRILNAISAKILYIKGNVRIYIQKFYAPDEDMQICTLPNDGLLKFYATKIIKCKQFDNRHVVSVDLLMRRSDYIKNLVEFLQKKYTNKCKYVNDANNYQCLLTYNNCKPTKHNTNADILYNTPVLQSLQFNGGRNFIELAMDGWTVDMSKCPHLETASNRLINIFIFEFLIDLSTKCLIYQRIRYDKNVANSHQQFVDMLKSIEK